MRDADQLALRAWAPVRGVVLGEVTTRLLNTSEAVEPRSAAWLLDLVPGSRSARTGHPIQRVVSPTLPFGVDCQLAAGTERPGENKSVRSIGVVSAHAVLTGGHILQGAAMARVVPAASTARQRWSHYSSRTGYLEVVRKADPSEIAERFLGAGSSTELLDLGGISKQVLSRVAARVPSQTPARLKTQHLRLRWNAMLRDDAGDRPSADFIAAEDGTFLVSVQTREENLAAVARFCEDLALHAWMLSSVTRAFNRSSRLTDKLAELGPALEYLGHLWSPGAHVDQSLDYMWASVEATWQLSQSWQRQVARLRDRIALVTLRALQAQAEAHEAEKTW